MSPVAEAPAVDLTDFHVVRKAGWRAVDDVLETGEVLDTSDFRNVGIIAYYAKAVGPARYLQYYSGTNLPPGGPQWVLLHRLDGETPPTADLFAADGAHYRQEGVYPHGPLSGWTWYLFRNLDPGVLPAAGR